MNKLFAATASVIALAASLGAATPASAQEGGDNIFKNIFGGVVAAESDETGTKAPGPMAASRMPTVMKNAAAFLQSHGCKAGDPIYFRVYKLEGLVDVLAQCNGPNAPYKLLDTWKATETNGVMQKLGYKLYEGDKMIPEGMRTIYGVKDSTNWYLGINFGYPDALDRSRPLPKGKASRGGLTLFHGPYGSRGCVPLPIAKIELAYGIVDLATKHNTPTHIDIFPTKDMSTGNLRKLAKGAYAKYLGFWLNMAELDRTFAETKIRYPITGQGTQYAFSTGTPETVLARYKGRAATQVGVNVLPIPSREEVVTPKAAELKRVPPKVAMLTPPAAADIPLYQRFKTGPINLKTGFEQTPYSQFPITPVKVTKGAPDEDILGCAFTHKPTTDLCKEFTTDYFYNPRTGELRKMIIGGKQDSVGGDFIPVNNFRRMMQEGSSFSIFADTPKLK